MKYRVLVVVLTIVTSLSAIATRRVSLNSADGNADWQITRQIDLLGYTGQRISNQNFKYWEGIDAVVPGCTFTSYIEAELEEDPNYGDNIYHVDETFYNRPFWYRGEFATPQYAEGERVWLHFDNTNRFADFYFNGVKLSGTASSIKDVSGHMIRTKYDITDKLNKNGKNLVAVLIYDPDQKKTRTASDVYGVACSPSYLAGAGWDWMPYVPGRLAGITGNVYLQITGTVVLEDPWVRSDMPTLDEALLGISTRLRNVESVQKNVEVEGTIMPGNITFKKTVTLGANAETEVKFNSEEFSQLQIKNPRLWWPNGYGEQALYTCEIKCKSGGVVMDEKTVTFGIKKYEYQNVTNSSGYPVLTLFVNGRKVYVKGGNWGMSEYLLRCRGEEYEKKIRLHKDMNYNMIRLWTGCVTDDEFYDYCDRYGIMIWDDFWLYFSYFGVAQPEAFKNNALDKVRRLRNHPSIAVWCGANETTPAPELNDYLRELIAKEDAGDRLYKPCSNNDGLSGSGWWTNQTPDRYFDSASNAMAFDGENYPNYFTSTAGYGMRTEIGLATFPTYESVCEFIPANQLWPLPSDDVLRNQDFTVWNHHFFGKEASNAGPVDYKSSINNQYGESSNLEEFCEKAQLLNIESSKGMYEAWNDKLWNDAAGLLLWMSNPAYPSFVWQTYDYYYETTGTYWGVKKACEHHHVQWNSLTNSVKVINTSGIDLQGVAATAEVFDMNGKELTQFARKEYVNVPSASAVEAFVLDYGGSSSNYTPIRFIRLTLTNNAGDVLSENFYWTNGKAKYNYHDLKNIADAKVQVTISDKSRLSEGVMELTLTNNSDKVAFANRLRFVNKVTGERILPVIMSDNYVTVMPGEKKKVLVESINYDEKGGFDVLIKQYGCKERVAVSEEPSGIDQVDGNKHVSVVACEGGIEVRGANLEGAAIRVLNMQGQVVKETVADGYVTSVEMRAGAIYMVQVKSKTLNETHKVIVK